jgi:hypothetical protein
MIDQEPSDAGAHRAHPQQCNFGDLHDETLVRKGLAAKRLPAS